MLRGKIISITEHANGKRLITDLGHVVWVKTETAAKHGDALSEGKSINIREVEMTNGGMLWVLDQNQTDISKIASARVSGDLSFQIELERTRQLAFAKNATQRAAAAVEEHNPSTENLNI